MEVLLLWDLYYPVVVKAVAMMEVAVARMMVPVVVKAVAMMEVAVARMMVPVVVKAVAMMEVSVARMMVPVADDPLGRVLKIWHWIRLRTSKEVTVILHYRHHLRIRKEIQAS
ncbi:hypothetical protein NMD70_06805 [Edwardsiella tarda]|uniref:hypothetical protein n=1 Tax=Edwardsiella tarda TaxID=636 RepID=UPI00351C6CB3